MTEDQITELIETATRQYEEAGEFADIDVYDLSENIMISLRNAGVLKLTEA